MYFDWDNQLLMLTAAAAARLIRLEQAVLHGPGLGFAVCVDEDVVYGGALWTSLSSVPYPGIVIDVYPAHNGQPLPILLGYPLGFYDELEDLRYEETLRTVLEYTELLASRP